MKIVLVRIDIPTLQLVPPLGLGYISAYLNRHGIETKIIDGLRDNLQNEQILKIIKNDKPDAVGISCLTAEYNIVMDLANLIKKTNIKVIIGGIHPTVFPYQTLIDSQADFVICGEGEIALTKLALNKLENNDIKGVYSLENLKSDTEHIEYAEQVENLDVLPFPSWKQIPPNTYKKRPSGLIYKKMPIGYMITSRGCIFDCVFCACPYISRKKVRFRSIENIILEMKELINLYGVKEIKFLDDNIGLKKEHVLGLCKKIIENNISITWVSTGFRANNIDDEVVAMMKKSGCYNISIGIESADSQILKNVKKNETIEEINNAINIIHKHKIICGGLFIFGLPGETKETMQETIKFALKSNLTLATFNILDILPGSQLWNDLDYKFDRSNLQNSYSEPRYLYGNITKKDIIMAQRKAFSLFYFRPKIFFRLFKFIQKEPVMYFFERLFKKVKA
ncbi:MAG: radical SAM protein [Endomicrobiaceae bacterium]|nr:radical SAM protein [Endomicrobiaceae bacterium]